MRTGFLSRPLALCSILLSASVLPGCAQDQHQREPIAAFQEFWRQFRRAALAGDKEELATLTRFPFRTRGTLDTDSTVAYDRPAFLVVVDRLLEQDSGMRPEPETMRDLINRTDSVTTRFLGDGGPTARIGAFVFERGPDGWRFARAYIDE